jgi:CRISPR/Cas system-associated exonuclease Cas4 (RecB family)
MYIKHQLKNGLTLDFDDEKHLYLFNGKKVESVTGICGNGVPKPELQGWLISTPVREIKNSINTLLDNGESLDRVILERIVDKAKNKTEEIKKDAGLIGTVVHGLIEDFLKNKKIPNQSDKKVINCWNLFLDWWNTQEYEVVELEKKIFSKKYNYAGTLDLVLKDKQGNLVLADIKTSNSISFDYALQLNAYRQAYEEETNNKISKGLIIRLPKTTGNIEIRELPLNKQMFDAFIGARNICIAKEQYKQL